ncbi:substrate-binding domain-containing protein [Barrientosiimonas humi]|uniref:substrate-binding domain-containing protein n=1 Tax=Barrientosiimonas humi TaxID=999931 RepID=UPI00370D1232
MSHARPEPEIWRRPRVVLAAALAVLVAVAGVLYLRSGDDQPQGQASCDKPVTVSVTTTDEMFTQVKGAGDLLSSDPARCTVYQVQKRDPGAVATQIRETGQAPDVWIPDSRVWADNVNAEEGPVRLKAGPVLASSPVVMAIPQSLAAQTRWKQPQSWTTMLGDTVPVTTDDPNVTTSSLVAVIAANQSVRGKEAKTKLLANYLRLSRSSTSEDVLYYFADKDAKAARVFPTSEQRLASYNSAHPDSKLTALVPSEGAGELTYTWVTPVKPKVPAKAVDALLGQLTSPEGRSQMSLAGLRVAGGQTPRSSIPSDVKFIGYPSLDESQGAQRAWVSLRKDARMLVLVDVSGSMSSPAEPGSKTTRIQMLNGVASNALGGLPKSTAMGAWAFSTDLDGKGKDYLELAPDIKPLTAPHIAELRRQLARTPSMVAKNGDTGLYDSISAAYRFMTSTYDPDYVNSVVVLTDGKNDDPGGGLDLAKLLTQLKGQYDRKKPIKIVTISIGQGTDPQALQQVVNTTNGLNYVTNSPSEITSVFVDAFLRRGE